MQQLTDVLKKINVKPKEDYVLTGIKDFDENIQGFKPYGVYLFAGIEKDLKQLIEQISNNKNLNIYDYFSKEKELNVNELKEIAVATQTPVIVM